MSNMAIDHDDSGAIFSADRKDRYALWRIWDRTLPRVCFIGLNPSTANEVDPDPTIKSVGRIARHNGYGGVVMMNCFPIVSSNPEILKETTGNIFENERYLKMVYSPFAFNCPQVVFAWGNFKEVKMHGMDRIMTLIFPCAMALAINKNGTPKHPLYCKTETEFIHWKFENLRP